MPSAAPSGGVVPRSLIRSFSGELDRCGDDIHESAVAHDRDWELASDRVGEHEALQRLGVNAVGELAMRTEAELLGVKNFGQTSLQEIKLRLNELGLDLRKLE